MRPCSVLFRCSISLAALLALIACESRQHPAGGRVPAPMQSGRVPAGSFIAESEAQRAPGEVALPPYLDADEVWIIARDESSRAGHADPDQPGGGAFMCTFPDRQPVPLPLEHTDVHASIHGYIASVDVTQRFVNPFASKIEAVYLFPLPEDAAVTGFIMTIGDRKIRGIIREREEAEQIYDQARSQGYRAALLTQDRPNIFTQKVANIEPGNRIDVNIRYFHTLDYSDGWYSFVFPMVVGPRFNPPASADPIHPISRGAPMPATEKNLPYLRPTERSGHDIDLAVHLDPAMEVREVQCGTHRVDVGGDTVRLAADDRIPNKDFVLRYRLEDDTVRPTLLTHQGQDRSYFTLMVHPPAGLASLPREPVEFVFVVDCSGSMSGGPMDQAKAAMRRVLRQLGPDDTFQVIRFSDKASPMGRRPLAATPPNVRKGLRYVEQLDAGGGTHMLRGMEAALNFPADRDRQRYVCFLTDGYIGNEAEVLGLMHDRLGDARVFSFGIGSSPNRFLLERMASMGRGAVAYVGLRDDADAVMDRFFQRVSHPALTDLELDFGGANVQDVLPRRLPDLFVGRPVVVVGTYRGLLPNTIGVIGRAGGHTVRLNVPVPHDAGETDRPAIASLWARRQIQLLTHAQIARPKDAELLVPAIRQLALDHDLMSAYTAFLAVDASQVTGGTYGTTVHQALPVPEGVRYDTTVTR